LDNALAAVQDCDWIALDTDEGSLQLEVSNAKTKFGNKTANN
jgi:hypothetical protein